MKRSEMLLVLEEAIHNNYDYCSEKGSSICYDEVLTELEEAGMIPECQNCNNKGCRGDPGFSNEPCTNEWESEDEA